MAFDTAAAYRSYLQEAAVPQGFRFFTTTLSFVPPERPEAGESSMNLSFIESAPPATAVAVTTGNRFCGAPVTIARERLPGAPLSGIVINNKVANVASPTGVADARTVAGTVAREHGLSADAVLPVSTGVIGWSLPVDAMTAAVPDLLARPSTPAAVAEAIMTTDRYPKLAWRRSGAVRCLGIAKGAGMIEPNLATMLAFVVCDAAVDPEVLSRVLRRVTDRTFNRISVDSDQSTSDMVVVMANGAARETIDEAGLETLLEPVCRDLALEIVRNGEGTAHVIEVTVSGVPDSATAVRIARHVANSPLVKTAVYGNDPNVGRILGATGDALDTWDPTGTINPDGLQIAVFDRPVYRDGAFRLDGEVEAALADRLAAAAMDPTTRGFPQDRGTVPIHLSFRGGEGDAVTVYGSDLSYEYIRENADYRT